MTFVDIPEEMIREIKRELKHGTEVKRPTMRDVRQYIVGALRHDLFER